MIQSSLFFSKLYKIIKNMLRDSNQISAFENIKVRFKFKKKLEKTEYTA